MVPLKLLILTLTFYELIIHLDAATCPKGQRVVLSRGKITGCADCHHGSYQPEENKSQRCQACRKCNEKSGSVTIKQCTKETNTKCKCRGEFVPSDSDSSTCKCDIGFGQQDGECSECEHGYFSTSIDSPCQKWKECKSTGENIPGTKTSDVICNESKNDTYVITTPKLNKIVSPTTNLTSLRPHEGAQTHTTTTAAAPRHTVTPRSKVLPIHPSNTGNHIGMALLIFGIVGLLVLTAVTCKLHVTPHTEKQPAVQKNESLCGSPVEESGDDSLASLKLYPEEH